MSIDERIFPATGYTPISQKDILFAGLRGIFAGEVFSGHQICDMLTACQLAFTAS